TAQDLAMSNHHPHKPTCPKACCLSLRTWIFDGVLSRFFTMKNLSKSDNLSDYPHQPGTTWKCAGSNRPNRSGRLDSWYFEARLLRTSSSAKVLADEINLLRHIPGLHHECRRPKHR